MTTPTAGPRGSVTTFGERLAGGEFVLTAELVPPVSGNAALLLERARPLAGLADAVNVTDGAGARPHMCALAAGALLRANGIEPIMQMTCRDRNRLAMQGDILGAAALGITSFLVMQGDQPSAGDQPEAKGVFDLASRDVMAMMQRMRDAHELPSGRRIDGGLDGMTIGCADMPIDPPADWKPTGLAAKVDAGASFAQTQFCMDAGVVRRYLARLAEHGLLERLRLIIGVVPPKSAKAAAWIRKHLYGSIIPEAFDARLERASDPAAEGVRLCADFIAELKTIKGVAGAHIMAPGNDAAVIAVLRSLRQSWLTPTRSLAIGVRPLYGGSGRPHGCAMGSDPTAAETAMKPLIAVIAPGVMGSAVAARLVERGADVVTSLAGRSPASAARAEKAGMRPVSDADLADAAMILSIVPPSDALGLAERLAPVLAAAKTKPVYVDCNAVSAATAKDIARVIAATGAPFADAGIIGGPPRAGYAGPSIYVSGSAAASVAKLGDLGLRDQAARRPGRRRLRAQDVVCRDHQGHDRARHGLDIVRGAFRRGGGTARRAGVEPAQRARRRDPQRARHVRQGLPLRRRDGGDRRARRARLHRPDLPGHGAALSRDRRRPRRRGRGDRGAARILQGEVENGCAALKEVEKRAVRRVSLRAGHRAAALFAKRIPRGSASPSNDPPLDDGEAVARDEPDQPEQHDPGVQIRRTEGAGGEQDRLAEPFLPDQHLAHD